MRTTGSIGTRAWAAAWACSVFVVGGASLAQAPAVDANPSRATIEEAAGDGCSGVSVVVRRCANAPASTNASGKPADARDPLTRSRARTKAGFARRDRQSTQDALDGKAPAPAPAGEAGGASRLAPITVTGTATGEPPTVEEVLQRALNPTQVTTANGNTITYGPDGARTECQSHCTGPMCCKTMKARPDPARESHSIGR